MLSGPACTAHRDRTAAERMGKDVPKPALAILLVSNYLWDDSKPCQVRLILAVAGKHWAHCVLCPSLICSYWLRRIKKSTLESVVSNTVYIQFGFSYIYMKQEIYVKSDWLYKSGPCLFMISLVDNSSMQAEWWEMRQESLWPWAQDKKLSNLVTGGRQHTDKAVNIWIWIYCIQSLEQTKKQMCR